MKPTRLYIKKCSHCNLQYFGKTVSENIERYKGGGVRWNHHLKKHEAKSLHVWNSDWYYHRDDIFGAAQTFSSENDIVESNNWANIVPEDGLNDRGNTSKFTAAKIGDALRGIPKSETHKMALRKPKSKEGCAAIRKGRMKISPEKLSEIGKLGGSKGKGKKKSSLHASKIASSLRKTYLINNELVVDNAKIYCAQNGLNYISFTQAAKNNRIWNGLNIKVINNDN